ncbi:hypothetical protein [Brevibacillus reuszeri]|uniref:hypothetical protein n=1 Tax=Brevibacillus reuszeri TaxID=54915 RepID=UPI003D1FE5AD
MKLNWLNRAIQGYQRTKFPLESKLYNQLDRLVHAVNYFRDREDNGEDTYVCTDVPSISRVFLITGIERAMDQGFLPFAKAFHYELQFRALETNHKSIQTFAYLHTSEKKAIADLYALVSEYVEREHLNHMQPQYFFNDYELFRFFIKGGIDALQNKPVKNVSQMISMHSI